MKRLRVYFRRRYGEGPLHLLSLIACFALAGYVVTRILYAHSRFRIAIWFAAAVIAHDLVLWPLYAIADRSVIAASRRTPGRLPAVPWINHLRVPAVISGALLLISFPLVFKLSNGAYHAASGRYESPYLGHWLLITGTLFAVSAVVYAGRLRLAVGNAETTQSTGDGLGSAQHSRHVAHGAQGTSERPGDLGAATAPPVGDVDLDDSPTLVGRSDDHFERPTEAAVHDPELDEGPAGDGAHRPEVAEVDPAAAAEPPGQDLVADPGVNGPGSPAGDPAAENQVGSTGGDGPADEGKVGPVE